MTTMKNILLLASLAPLLFSPPNAQAQTPDFSSPSAAPQGGADFTLGAPTPAPVGSPHALVYLSAIYAPGNSQPVKAGLVWRVFAEQADPDGSRRLVAESSDASPSFSLNDGSYIVHVACGLAGATKKLVIEGGSLSERVTLNAGGLKIVGVLGEQQTEPKNLQVAIFVPERGNPEGKLILPNLKTGEAICLPEGSYHIVSKLLDISGSSYTETNSVIYADLRVQAGKLTEGDLRHRAATMTLKLVNAPGGEALANTSFSVLTPGGDVIRELIGAFPSLVLAEGEYVAIARHDGKTYQNTFKVQSTVDRDIEVVAQ